MHAEYLGQGVFALLHGADPAGRSPTAVVLVPPFGSEEAASYRERRWLAGALADAGHPTLRLDLPGTGDSAGGAGDPERLTDWARAVRDAATRMRSLGGRLAVVALGLGGLAAVRAATQGAPIDDLVLWAVPGQGRAAVRRLRSLARLQPNRLEPVSGELPEGALEIGGYVLDDAMLTELAAADLAATPPLGAERVLLLGRDGEGPPEALAEAWRAAGLAVAAAGGEGYDAMLEHPERTNPPRAVAEHLTGWLAGAPAAGRPGAAAASRAAPVAVADRLELVGGSEAPFELAGGHGRLFGILATPDVPHEDLCVVLLSAGALRRTGPNRMWVEAARRALADGVAALRVDLAAIGDSDGDEQELRDVAWFHRPEVTRDIVAILDELERRGVGSRFVLLGLCSGAYGAFQVAAADSRVVAAGLLNPRVLVWVDDLHAQREARKLRRVVSREGWKDFLGGGISGRAILAATRTALRLAAVRGIGRAPTPDPAAAVTSVDDGLARLRARDVPLVIGFSGEEPLVADLEAAGTRARLAEWPNVTWVELPGADHELRPIAAQRAGQALLERTVEAARSPAGVA